jgi:hypothetical protein
MDQIAEQIDRLENLIAGLDLPMPASVHLSCLRESLPELTADLKAAFIAAGGDDYWEFHP